MKLIFKITLCLAIVLVGVLIYFSYAYLNVRHYDLSFYDASRTRQIDVQVTVRRDKEWLQSKFPVAIIFHGNTVKYNEYSFVANIAAAKGYLVLSIQNDLPSDPPLPTIHGEPFVGRIEVYHKTLSNVFYVLHNMKDIYPQANFHDNFLLIGHSNGGDAAIYYSIIYPESVSKIITFDNLRVPLPVNDKIKVLSFRSKDPDFKTDQGVMPTRKQRIKYGIEIIKTPFMHTWLSDRGAPEVLNSILLRVEKFL